MMGQKTKRILTYYVIKRDLSTKLGYIEIVKIWVLLIRDLKF